MTIARVKAAAACRGIYFSGDRDGMWYSCFIPWRLGGGHLQADTLNGLYNMIMQRKKIFRSENEYWESDIL